MYLKPWPFPIDLNSQLRGDIKSTCYSQLCSPSILKKQTRRAYLKPRPFPFVLNLQLREEIKSTCYSQLCSWYSKPWPFPCSWFSIKRKQCTRYSQLHFPPLVCPAASKMWRRETYLKPWPFPFALNSQLRKEIKSTCYSQLCSCLPLRDILKGV